MLEDGLAGFGGAAGFFMRVGQVQPGLGMLGAEADGGAPGLRGGGGVAVFFMQEALVIPGFGVLGIELEAALDGALGAGVVALAAAHVGLEVVGLGVAGGEDGDAAQGLRGAVERAGADVVAGEQEPGEGVFRPLLDGLEQGFAVFAEAAAAGGGGAGGGVVAQFGEGELVPVEAGFGVEGHGFALAVHSLGPGAEVGGGEAEQGPAFGAAGVFAGDLDELAQGELEALLLQGLEGADEGGVLHDLAQAGGAGQLAEGAEGGALLAQGQGGGVGGQGVVFPLLEGDDHADEGGGAAFGVEHGGAGGAGGVVAADVEPAEGGDGGVCLDACFGEHEAALFGDGEDVGGALLGEVGAGCQLERGGVEILALEQGHAGALVHEVKAGHAAAGAVGVDEGDVVGLGGDLGVEEAGVGEQDAVGGDVAADAGGELDAEGVPDAQADDGGGDFLAEGHEALLFGAGRRGGGGGVFLPCGGRQGQEGREEIGGEAAGQGVGAVGEVEEGVFVLVHIHGEAGLGQGRRSGLGAWCQGKEHGVRLGGLFLRGGRGQRAEEQEGSEGARQGVAGVDGAAFQHGGCGHGINRGVEVCRGGLVTNSSHGTHFTAGAEAVIQDFISAMFLPAHSRISALAALTLLLGCLASAGAAELELRSLGAPGEGQEKRKFGPFVSVMAGETLSQSGQAKVGARNFPVEDIDGSAIFSVEVGKTWNIRRVPVEFSLSAEATFTSTTLQGSVPDANLNADQIAEYQSDMNSLIFSLNGTFALDLYRYRARIGKFWGGFKPYVGGGLGGGQVWFRNSTAKSADQVQGGTTEPGEAVPFSIDEFINVWNWRAGLEWSWEERYSIFAEYRKTYFGDLDDLRGFRNDGYLVGFRYRY